MLHLFLVALSLCYSSFKLHYFHFYFFFILQPFHPEFFSWCTHVAPFSVFHSFHVAPFFLLHSFHVATFFILGSLLVEPFFFCISSPVALFSCCDFFMLHFSGLDLHFWPVSCFTRVMVSFYSLLFLTRCPFHIALFNVALI